MQKVEMIRLIADEGKELVNSNGTTATCVDTFPDKLSEWSEQEAEVEVDE